MVFIELTPFIAFRKEHWSDEDLRALQNFLMAQPLAGDVIRGASGLRKLRWQMAGAGKRGGARVIYYHVSDLEHLYLIYAYAKSDQEDLTPSQTRQLAQLMKGLTDET
jgi:hypothetical protein